MGNCQAAEAATVVIQHPSGRVERVYWSLSASQVMASNPGHYVAVIIASTSNSSDSHTSSSSSSNAPVKRLKLLRPADTLHIGHVYRLVSFEEVLREFASKRHVKQSRLLVEQKDKPSSKKAAAAAAAAGGGGKRRQGGGGPATEPESSLAMPQVVESPARAEVEFEELVRTLASNRRTSSGAAARHGQWRPALQSIAEIGS